MTDLRWWHVAVLGTTAVLSVIAFFDGRDTWMAFGAVAANAVFALAWFVIGRRAWVSPAAGIVFTVITIVSVGISVAFVPWMSVIQVVAFPVLWAVSRSFRAAIVANVALAVAVGIGQFLSTGADADAAVQATVIELVSLAFSIAIGLWITSIETQSSARQRLVDELQSAQEQLAALSRDAGITSERERLAREIHDTIAQDLTGLVLLSQQSRRSLAAGDAEAADQQLAQLEENARLALTETRALVAATSPAALDDGGILPALERLAARFERETSIQITIDSDVAAPLDRATEVVLLRCAQESLANVRKHSGADAAQLALVATPRGATLTIEDNGSGFDPASVGQGYGLTGMRERLALVGGDLELTSSPAGTRVVVTLPGGTA